ncbi:MAG TPA: choice-of-anchor D domain-containing protein [Acidobacteriaceae bacterium]|nr:choice-of-anchor D domain-containing protein [Acidobacteriaceae bacterium]
MLQAAAQSPVPAWQPVGPAQVSTSSFGPVTGRITSIAADPSDPTGNTVYLGSTGGGVWKSINAAGSPGAVSFTPLTDNLSAFSPATLTSLSIGAVSVQPGGTGVVLAGTGDPNDATDSWYGAGLLRSTDGGNTWALITRAAQTASGVVPNFIGNAFAGFAWSNSSPNLVVAAVSQSEYSAIIGLSNQMSLLGLYYSRDAGATWQLATIQDGSTVIESSTATVVAGNSATSVVWNPLRRRFYAAIRNHGYYESADGSTFTRLPSQPGADLTTTLCPPKPGNVGSFSCPMFRGVLAVQPVSGDMFALSVDQNNLDQGFWQDVCNPTSNGCTSATVQFGTRISDTALESSSGDGTLPQGTYNLALAAVPSQQDTLLFAGTTDIWRCSLANSCSWRNTTNTQTCAAAKVFAAQHAIDTTFGSSGLIYFGNDGGLWRTQDAVNQTSSPCSSDDASHFQNLNAGIGSLAEVEDFSADPTNASTWLAALGPLGTAAPAPSASAWNQVLNGEGNFVAIDPGNPQDWYATSEFGVGINACHQGTSCNAAAFGSVVIGEAQVGNDVQLIPAPWLLDPQDSSQLILGTCHVWRGPVTGAGWSTSSLLSNSLDGQAGPVCNGNAEIRSIAAAPIAAAGSGSQPAEQLYAGMAGLLDGGGLVPGHVFTAAVTNSSTASTTSWMDIGNSPVSNDPSLDYQFNPGGFDISSLYIDPHDPTAQTVYATVQGYYFAPQSGEATVYRSTDAGAHWTDISIHLPLGPANSIVVDPNDPRVVYVALDTGVYYTNDVTICGQLNQSCWNVYGTGLPNAPVTRLQTFNSGGTALLRAATYGRGIWQIPLATADVLQAAVSVTPAFLTFDAQPVQTTSAAQTITVTNTGSLALSSSVSTTGDFHESDTCSGQSIPPNSSCQIKVTFNPMQTGTRTGALEIYGNFATGEFTVPLYGTGLVPASITLMPSSLTWPATTVGSVSASQIVSVKNDGGSPAALQSETVTGDFSLSGNSCGASLAAQTSCSLTVVFQPTASGTRSGILTVSDDSGTQTAALSGIGQAAPTDTLSTTSLIFRPQMVGTTSATQQVTLTNNGDQSLTQITASVSSPFTLINNCGLALQGHSSCLLLVAFAPVATGTFNGLLTLQDQFGTKQVQLSGSGVAAAGLSATPASIDFGSIAVGSTSAAQLLTIANNSGSAASGLAGGVTGGFAIASNNCPSTLNVGASCQIGITFSPAATGPATGTVTLTADNLPKAVTVSLSGAGEDFSLGVAGSSSAVLTSGQTASFTLQLSGATGATGTIALTCKGAPQNATCSLNPATLTLTGANSSSAMLSITTGVQTTGAATAAPLTQLRLPLLAIFIPALWIGLRARKLRGLWLIALAIALLVPAGCSVASGGGSGSGSGGGSGGSGGGGGGAGGGAQQYPTPPGTYTIIVTGTMANIAHTTSVTLTVQ